MTETPVRCKKCGHKVKIANVGGLKYAQCSNPKCTKWDPYQFLGVSDAGAIRTWNIYNSNGKIEEATNE